MIREVVDGSEGDGAEFYYGVSCESGAGGELRGIGQTGFEARAERWRSVEKTGAVLTGN